MKDDGGMGQMTTEDALAVALASMVSRHTVTDVLARLMQDCLQVLSADAAAVLVRSSTGSLELLSASSHRAEEIELLQIQHAAGPCVDSVAANEILQVRGRDELVERWGTVGAAIVDAGYDAVQAYPMHWQGQAIGGLNVLVRDSQLPADLLVGQILADIATLVVVHAGGISPERALARVREAVEARTVVEQAKGVLAVELETDPALAYDALLERAEESGRGLTVTAIEIIGLAHER
jgi:hypothetical protein